MAYALLYDVPADEPMYRKVREFIGDEQPKGLVAHVVIRGDHGLRHIGVWNSQADWQRFNDERVRPAVHAVLTAAGFAKMPPDPPIQELDLIDVWLGA
jgi:hypothetical protein